MAAVARVAPVRRQGRRPVRLPRSGPGDLPRGQGGGSWLLPEIILDQNCRNAQPIHDVVRRFAGEGHAELAMRSDGRSPELIEVQTPEDTVRAQRSVLHRLRFEEEVRPWDIAVLTGARLEASAVWAVPGRRYGTRSWEIPPSTTRGTTSVGRPPRSAASRRRHPVRHDPPLQRAGAPGHHPGRVARGGSGQARSAAVHRCVAGAATPCRYRIARRAGPSAMSPEVTRAERLAGAVWGTSSAMPWRAIRVRASRPAASVEFGATGAHGQPPGTWSDDGRWMLALLNCCSRSASTRRTRRHVGSTGTGQGVHARRRRPLRHRQHDE